MRRFLWPWLGSVPWVLDVIGIRDLLRLLDSAGSVIDDHTAKLIAFRLIEKILISVIIFLFRFLPNTDERSILRDLDLDLLSSRFLDLSFVKGLVPFGFFRGLGDSSFPKIVLEGLLHRSRQITHRYLLRVFVLLGACINQGCTYGDSEDGGCQNNYCFHWVGTLFFFTLHF